MVYNNTLKNKPLLCKLPIIFILSLSLLVLVENVYATHISEPILSLDNDAQYNLNETISANGWIKYNEQPASDVLVQIKILNPNGKEIYQDQIRSDQNGNFTTKVNLLGNNVTEGGTFTLSATSHCKDEHRNICNYKSSSQTFVVIN